MVAAVLASDWCQKTNQKPEWRRPFGNGLVRRCPQGLFLQFFTFLRSIYIFSPIWLSLVPTICPWVSEDGGGEREEKTPARKHCWNEKHPLIRHAWPLFQKWVANNNKTTKQSLQYEDSHCLKKNELELIIVFILTESQCNSLQLMKLQFKLQFLSVNRYPWEFNILQTI